MVRYPANKEKVNILSLSLTARLIGVASLGRVRLGLVHQNVLIVSVFCYGDILFSKRLAAHWNELDALLTHRMLWAILQDNPLKNP